MTSWRNRPGRFSGSCCGSPPAGGLPGREGRLGRDGRGRDGRPAADRLPRRAGDCPGLSPEPDPESGRVLPQVQGRPGKAGPVRLWAVDPRAGVKKALEGAAWFLPLGLLAARVPRWRLGGGQAAWEVLGLGVGAAAGAEFVRLFVVTHSCDATDMATNGLAVLGGWCRVSVSPEVAADVWRRRRGSPLCCI